MEPLVECSLATCVSILSKAADVDVLEQSGYFPVICSYLPSKWSRLNCLDFEIRDLTFPLSFKLSNFSLRNLAFLKIKTSTA